MFITWVVGGILGIIYFGLSARIMFLRNKHQISLGNGKIDELELAIRVHGNFAEFVPLCLILLFFSESTLQSKGFIYALGGMLIVGRIAHAFALYTNNRPARVVGVILTMLTLLGGSILSIKGGLDQGTLV